MPSLPSDALKISKYNMFILPFRKITEFTNESIIPATVKVPPTIAQIVVKK